MNNALTSFKKILQYPSAGGIDSDHLAPRGLLGHGFWHAMGGKDHRTVGGAFVEFLDKDGTLGAQVVADELIMHHFMADVDRCAQDFDGTFVCMERMTQQSSMMLPSAGKLSLTSIPLWPHLLNLSGDDMKPLVFGAR